eukprot:gene18095-19903_t
MLRKIAIKRNSVSLSSSEGRYNEDDGNTIGSGSNYSTVMEETTKLYSATEQHVEEDEDEALPFIIDYLGFDQISEAQSLPLMKETLKKIKKHHTKTIRVDFVIHDGILKVSNVSQGALLITAPLYAVALCAQEQLRGFDSTFAINITRRRVHLCHVFQAGSRLEASSIVRFVALAFKSVGKLIKERRERHLLAESSLSSSERIRSESDASRYRHRTESEGSRDRQRSSADATPARKRRASGSNSRNKSALGPSSLAAVPPEETAGEGQAGKHEVVTVQVHKDVQAGRRQMFPNEARDAWSQRSFNAEACIDDERQCGIDADYRELEEKKSLSGIIEYGREESWEDRSESSKVDDLFLIASSAIESANLKQIDILIDSGLSVNVRDNKGLSLLHHAALRNQADVVALLLERDADPNCEGPEDQTPLHFSAAQGNRMITKLLLEYGANVRAQDRLFRSPLHMCAGNLQSLEVSFILVEHGARIEDNDLEGTRPVDLQPELQEMQNRLIQSACEAFTASDLSKTRSDSGSSSSRSSSLRSGKGLLQQTRRSLHKSNSFKRHSVSLQSIPDDNSDEDDINKNDNMHPNTSAFGSDYATPTTAIEATKSYKRDSFGSDVDLNKADAFLRQHEKLYDPKVNEKFLEKIVTKISSEDRQQFYENFSTEKQLMYNKRRSFPSDSEYSGISTKVEIDSIGMDDEDFSPLIIQDFKDSEPEQFSDNFSNSEHGMMSEQKDAVVKRRLVIDDSFSKETRLRSSTIKDGLPSSEMSETGSSMTGSSYDIASDVATICDSDNESITNLKNNLHSKLPRSDRASLASLPKLFKKDPASDALKLLVTLSFNPECHSSILASLCLPNSAGQVVAAARSTRTSLHHLNQIATLLDNLFTVSGPESKRKAVEAGLLKTVIDMLETAEPVQGTCLWILNDLLQSESEQDFSTAITNVPLEPLLVILERDMSARKQHQEKLQQQQQQLSNQEKTPSATSESAASARKLLHQPLHIHFLEKDGEITFAKPKREPKFLSEKRTSEKELKICETSPQIHFIPPPSEGVGRGRSDSFSSQSSRESSPSSIARLSSSVSDVRHCEAMPGTSLRQRRSSKGSGYSTDCSVASNNIAASSQPMVARNIAIKMIAAVSSNPKFHMELGKKRIIQILVHNLKDSELEVAVHASTTLSNIAMNVKTHSQLERDNVVEELQAALKHYSTKVRYHAARGLIYMGQFNIDGIHLFAALEADETLSNVIYTEHNSQQEHYYVRGTSIESLVLMLTKDIHLLWGGSALAPPSPGEKKGNARSNNISVGKETNRHAPSEQQILNFILTTYQSFVHPVIFIRLTLHRFHDPTYYKVFEELEETGEVASMRDHISLPPVHARLMRVWVTWLENYPGDFRRCPIILEELSELIEPMKLVAGPYLPCADRLEAIMNKIKADGSSRGSERSNHSESHHDILYEQCQKAIVSGSIPSTDDDFIYLASIQLYIEDLEQYGQDFPQRINTLQSITPARLKQSVHPSLSSSKNVLKRIKLQYEVILDESPTMRNAKHNYIDCCQGIEGFGCRFFKLKQKILAKGGKKHNNVTRLLGISAKRVAILDEQTKACIEKWNFKDLKRWGTTEDNLYLKLTFTNKTAEFQMDNKSIFKEVSNYVLTCSMEMGKQGFGNIDTSPWSSFAQQTGTWGVPALRLYLNELQCDLDNSPSSRFDSPLSCRERAVTFAPISPNRTTRPVYQRSESYQAAAKVSKSAPEAVDRGADLTSSFLDWLPFRGRKSHASSTRSELDSEATTSHSLQCHTSAGSPNTEGTSLRRVRSRRSSSSPKTHIEFTPVSVFEQHLSSHSHTSSSILSQSSNERVPMLEGNGESEASAKTNEKVQKELCKTISRITTCRCPPDAQLPNLNRRDFRYR